MNKALKWTGGAVLVAGVLVLGAVVGLKSWVGSSDFKARVERQATSSLGIDVKVGSINVSVWPQPTLLVTGIEVQTEPPLSLAHVEVQPELNRLLGGQWSAKSMVLRDATLPQHGIDALFVLLSKTKQIVQISSGLEAENANRKADNWLPRELLLKNVTWVNAKGLTMTMDLQAIMNADGEPDSVNARVLSGFLNGASAQLTRQNQVWAVALNIGGGTITGPLEFHMPTTTGDVYLVQGQFETKGVEMAAFSTTTVPVLSGQLDATTTLLARTIEVDELANVLTTKSQFTVKNAVLNGLDLAKAVASVGVSQGGSTPLDMLAGQLSTEGAAMQLSNLVASSGLLSANGQVSADKNGSLSGLISVNLDASSLGGAVGVPLEVGGTLAAPQVNLSRTALIGAAIGTVLLPGTGTAEGASVADRLGEGLKKLFGQ